jgi:KaiC/GvpD/RAD55 family RecA-like ATPase
VSFTADPFDFRQYMSDTDPAKVREVEQTVLGVLLWAREDRERVPELEPADFADPTHRTIMRALDAVPAGGDLVAVFDKLREWGEEDHCGGLAYLNDLAQSVPSRGGLEVNVGILKTRGRERRAATLRHQAAAKLQSGAPVAEVAELLEEIEAPAAPLLSPVDLLADAGQATNPQGWAWDGLVPMGYVTMLNGHGGSGKSTLALQMLLCMAAGRECLGLPTRPGVVCFYSAEDPKELVLRRLRTLSASLGVDMHEVRDRLHILDATEIDPVLFREHRHDGTSSASVTAAYRALQQFVTRHRVDVLVIDNASDTYEANEILRPLVRAFMRSLAQLTRSTGGATVLVAHVDKGTSRASAGASGSESYSGSTAWHNSARSRLFLLEREKGYLELRHEKCNVGPRRDPLRLSWPPGGAMELEDTAPAATQWIADRNDLKAILALIAEYQSRGEAIAPDHRSSRSAPAMLSGERTYPKRRKPGEVFQMLRDAERGGLVQREAYRDTNRKERERWTLTPKGAELAGVALGAPGAPGTDGVAYLEPSATGTAPSAPGTGTGGYGGMESAQNSARGGSE